MARRKATEATETAMENEDMTNATENEIQDGAEATEGTEAGGHTFNPGDEATVIRGKLRGRKGQILAYSATENTYAINLEGGTLATVNAGNLKAPADSTVSVQALVSTLAGFGQSIGSPDHDAAVRLAAMLDSVVPGVSTKLAEAFAS